MSLFGLWARRCRKWVALILLGMAAAEAGLFFWTMHRCIDIEYAFTESYIGAVAFAAFAALTAVLVSVGTDRGARSSYTLRRLAVTERQAFLCRAAHNTLCYFVAWGAQLAVALGLCLIWRHLFPLLWSEQGWGRQTALLTFYRVPFLHGLLPLGDWYGYARNLLWFMALGCMTAQEKTPAYALSMFFMGAIIYFPLKMGEDGAIGWAIFLSVVSLLAIVACLCAKSAGEEEPEEVSGDGAEA